jgi:hypothetical protein
MMLQKKITLLILFMGFAVSSNSQNSIKINGLIVDENNEPIPYAAVGLPSKSIGTATTEEGTFFLLVSKSNLSDVLEVSSIGFETFKIKIQDFINQKYQKIIIKEAVMSLDEIVLNNKKPKDYAKYAIRKLWKTTINETHQLNVLYRRFSVEDGKARFLVEHYINVLDDGPLEGNYKGVEIVAGRKSADYRFVKKKLRGYPIHVIGKRNPLRSAEFRLKDYDWKRNGDTSYDGEDILIVEGKLKTNKKRFVRLYVGMDTFGVYKIETSDLSSVYVYKKDATGKLHLSYHNRTRNGKVKLTATQKAILGSDKNELRESYKHEIFVLGVQRNLEIVNASDYKKFKKDIGDIAFKYNPVFWESFSVPPATAFYKKSVKELESIFGVPLEVQFKAVNR